MPLYSLDEVSLQLDELEALRLKDLKGLDQVDCAKEMGISQSTFQRILTAARAKVTEALIHGKAIRIEGGPVALAGDPMRRHQLSHMEEDSLEPGTPDPER